MSDVFDTDQGDKTANVLEELVGEGKKFADNEALAKGKVESDNFIEQLKTEKQEALDALTEAQKETGAKHTIADLMEAVRATQQTEGGDTKPLSDEDFQEKVRAIVEGDSSLATSQANRDKGNALVLQKFDGNVEAAQAHVAARAAALGTTVDKLQTLSEDSPALFAKAMEIEPSTAPASTAGLTGKVDTGNLTSDTVMEIEGHKTKAYYDAQRKEMGVRKYLDDHKLQNQMMADAIALQERFNN